MSEPTKCAKCGKAGHWADAPSRGLEFIENGDVVHTESRCWEVRLAAMTERAEEAERERGLSQVTVEELAKALREANRSLTLEIAHGQHGEEEVARLKGIVDKLINISIDWGLAKIGDEAAWERCRLLSHEAVK
jgi:hypothetical protein